MAAITAQRLRCLASTSRIPAFCARIARERRPCLKPLRLPRGAPAGFGNIIA
jgi:hypothetical protein